MSQLRINEIDGQADFLGDLRSGKFFDNERFSCQIAGQKKFGGESVGFAFRFLARSVTENAAFGTETCGGGNRKINFFGCTMRGKFVQPKMREFVGLTKISVIFRQCFIEINAVFVKNRRSSV